MVSSFKMSFLCTWPVLVALLAVGVASIPVEAQKASLYQTSKGNGDLLAKSVIELKSNPTRSSAAYVLSTSKKFQTILGFGGAFTEAAALTISKLPEGLQEEIVQAYFGPQGHQYSLGRVPIASCDFSTSSYSYDDVPGDLNLTRFGLNKVDTDLIIPLIKRAMNTSRQDIRIFASPWSPPAWMKRSNNMVGTSFPECLLNDDSIHAAWAKYLSKFVSAYEEHSLKLWGMTIQNEPLLGLLSKWEACSFTPSSQAKFVKDHLGPVMAAEHPGLVLMAYDDQKNFMLPVWVRAIVNDPGAAKYVQGFGVHWYTGPGFSHLQEVAQAAPHMFVLATEACCGYSPLDQGVKLGDWSRGEKYGHDILGDLLNGVVGWTDWNLVLDENGGPNHAKNFVDAAIIADTQKNVLHYQIPYFYMGHFSRFIPPGSVRIGLDKAGHTDTPESDLSLFSALELAAFLTPEADIVVVVMNRSPFSKSFSIAVDSSARYLENSIPPHSIQTYVIGHSCQPLA
mmetsp:Transcript_48365/g.121754  ORF Transcript_48365/g.121754 Transcript_48365/m.121754 type:complete len:509 (-) Transcript_48365:197-1723(-)